MQRAIADGYRSRSIDADDLVEALLAIADGRRSVFSLAGEAFTAGPLPRRGPTWAGGAAAV
jgi:DNA-binding NarL/FixJ family response regulator